MGASIGSHFENIKLQYLQKVKTQFSWSLHQNVQFSKYFKTKFGYIFVFFSL